MTALKVMIIIALVIAALLLTRIKIVIEYADELILSAKVLFFKIKIIPKKEKKVKPSAYTKKKLLKRQKKEADKEKKRLEKKAAKKAEAKEAGAQSEKKKKKPPILDTVRLVRLLLSIFLRRFFGHLRIDLARLNITVGGEDAAATAITYGYLCQSVAYLVEILDRFTNLKRTRKTEISVRPEFTAEKTVLDLHIAFSLTVAQALDIVFRTAFGYVKTKMKI